MDDQQNYWLLGDIRLRLAGVTDTDAADTAADTVTDEEIFYRHFIASSAKTERAFEAIGLPEGLDGVRKWLAAYVGGLGGQERTDDRHVFVVESAEGSDFLGYIDVWETDARSGVFKTGIKMADGQAGKGYATRSFTRVLDYYFNELRYQKCDVYIYEFNEASLRFHRKLGFVEEGRLRREYYTGGRYYDSVCFGLTREEFAAAQSLR